LWAIYESLDDGDKETYAKLKNAILDRLNPDTDEHHLATREQLSQWSGGREHQQASQGPREAPRPGLTADTREAELQFHLISLPDEVLFQLKLQPQGNYSATIAKG